MRRTQSRRRPVGAFTIIELIVVITIIAILAGLLLSAVVKAQDAALRAQTKAEIGELGLAIESFKSTYDVKYIPSFMILASDYSNPDPAFQDSRQYLSRVWPKMFPPNALPPNTALVLDGNQVLVFLLGGVPPQDSKFTTGWAGTRSGFMNSPTNPFKNQAGVCVGPQSGAEAKGPFFNFKADRIDENSHYHDPYWDKQTLTSSIYYYFSSKNGNDYQYFSIYNSVSSDVTAQGGYGGMNPFKTANGSKHLRPDSFQIISAGKNAQAGPGGNFESGIGNYNPNGPGGDDLANFHEGPLGSD